MLGFGRRHAVGEHEADGEIERVYHEIRQTLRVTGVTLNFRTLAAYGPLLPALWDALRPNLDTRAFEDAADRVRAEAVGAAARIGRLDAVGGLGLGESQHRQIQMALDLYHYVNPKLLVLTALARLGFDGAAVETRRGRAAAVELIDRGVPGTMYPMEMVEEGPADPEVRALFDDIQRTLARPAVNSDYRTLALWPGYLAAVWSRLKPILARQEYEWAAQGLGDTARALARDLPYPVPLTRERVTALGVDAEAVDERLAEFERLLPKLALNVALFALDWTPAAALARSPFPVERRRFEADGGRR